MDYNCDVLVCGGGPSGFAAAVSAARMGADTLLIERYGFLGGMATAGLVNPFMPYCAGDEQIINGIFQELIDRLGPTLPMYGNLIFDPETFKLASTDMCLESGARLLLHSFIVEVDAKDSIVESVQIANKSGMQSIGAKIFIDCTGDADIAYWSGVPCKKGRDEDSFSQPMTLNFRMANVDIDRMPSRERITEIYLQAREQGRVDCPRNDVLWFETTHSGEVHFNTTRVICADATNVEDLTRAELDARRQMLGIVAFLKSDVPGFEHSYLQMSAAQIGVRESRRIVGEYVMTVDDVLGARKFEDCIARGNYPVDIHDPKGGGTVIRLLEQDASYDIPYRSILPLGIDNLLVAGRPISTTHEAHSSTRIMPIAIAANEAEKQEKEIIELAEEEERTRRFVEDQLEGNPVKFYDSDDEYLSPN